MYDEDLRNYNALESVGSWCRWHYDEQVQRLIEFSYQWSSGPRTSHIPSCYISFLSTLQGKSKKPGFLNLQHH